MATNAFLMKRYEQTALAVMGLLVTGLVAATLAHPPLRVTAAPKAVLHVIAPLEPKPRVEAVRAPAIPTEAEPDTGATARLTYDSLRRQGYQLESVISGENAVPRLFLASLPGDMAGLRETQVRKDLFIKTVLPLILQVNEGILAERRRLEAIQEALAAGAGIAADDRAWLRTQGELYGVDADDLDGLMKRLDAVPPSLALAQAAEETGWGTSRFVRNGNALFGQYAFGEDGMMIPLRRDDDKSIAVRSFPTLLESVRAYVLNLNTHWAYRRYREARAKLRAKGKRVDGYSLASTLTRYSARGEDYTRTLRSIIAANEFLRLDRLRLKGPADDRPVI